MAGNIHVPSLGQGMFDGDTVSSFLQQERKRSRLGVMNLFHVNVVFRFRLSDFLRDGEKFRNTRHFSAGKADSLPQWYKVR